MINEVYFAEARRSFHAALLKSILRTNDNGVPSNADKDSRPSVDIAKGIMNQLGSKSNGARLAGQMSGRKFEQICKEYLEEIFPHLYHICPGDWQVSKDFSGNLAIANFEQYAHLSLLDNISKNNPGLSTVLGNDYLIRPDVVVYRYPHDDEFINKTEFLVNDNQARLTSIRKCNTKNPILHANISCKWTMRSDRAQNARSEALNLIRNRKGRLPHIIVVTAEPTPGRIASIALGTGDIDCVYHFALYELIIAVSELNYHDSKELLNTMIEGKRLKDISDLPLDLVL